MGADEMLERRDTVYLEWCDPWEALDSNLETYTGCVYQRATVSDCIGFSRVTAVKMGRQQPPDDKEALLEFISVMWAYPADPLPLPSLGNQSENDDD